MAHHSIGDLGDGVSHSRQLGSWGYPAGGMGAVSAAIARSARTFGAELRTSTRVESVSTSSGRVTGVVLENGDQLTAPLVVTSLHPKTAFLDHLPRAALPDDFVRDIERWNTRSGVVKINLALAELPSFTADPSSGPHAVAEHHTGSVEMSPTMEFIERAFQDAREGRAALLPFCDGVIPTTLDTSMNPDGTHIFSMFTQYVPHEWSDAPHTEELEAYTDRLIDLYDQVAPGFADSVTHRDIVGPHEMQEEYGLVGGNIFHGELTPEQLFHMRPAPGYADYRTPIAGLYNASSASHGGGGVCGIPGWQAAKAAISDNRSIRQRLRRRAG
jgi:phytoene dehydrogenase-like protein